MKKIILLSSLALFAVPSSVLADRYNNEYTYAKVVDVQPIYENVRVPQNRRVCEDAPHDDRRNRKRRSNAGGAIIGGIIGGLVGNRFGKGHGRQATTALGVVAGASIGSKAQSKDHHNDNQTRCYTQRDYYEEQRLTGYEVSYKYENRVYHTRMRNKPGDRVKINVDVRLAEH